MSAAASEAPGARQVTLAQLYADCLGSGAARAQARSLFEQSDWFCRVAEFDPKTGRALPQALSLVLARIAAHTARGRDQLLRDRLWRITEHSRAAMERLLLSLNEGPRREQAVLPIHMVRELDATSFIKLSNRPGRTIREKLAGKPYLHAVRRFQSVDLPENRLLKAYAIQLAQLLEMRRDCLGQEDGLLAAIQTWLRSAEAGEIGRWDNLPPNNTLLSHREYRSIWDAWCWLQSLDDDHARDLSRLASRDQTMRLWTRCARMWSEGQHLFAETPLLFDYENFEILPWQARPPVFRPAKLAIARQRRHEEINDPVCLDLSGTRPYYATADSGNGRALRATMLWQRWERAELRIDIELFHADAICLEPGATAISAADLFFCKSDGAGKFDQAARAFSVKLRQTFRHDSLTWLTPDLLSDFELEVVRRNLNARFPHAQPLPRSVAATFGRVDYAKIKAGFCVVVIDSLNGSTCVTRLVAKFDRELNERLPESRGLYWERQPSVMIGKRPDGNVRQAGYDIPALDEQGVWHEEQRPARPEFVDYAHLQNDALIGHYSLAINLADSPVAGGVRLHQLQQRAGDIPLWRDQITELSIKVMKQGLPHRFHLVTRGTTVRPVRGRPVPIEVKETFTLLAHKPNYSFPLFLGADADDLGYSARLDSPAFPLQEDVVCQLQLTFEYGADDPYKLVFVPLGLSLPAIRTTWRRATLAVYAPAPAYPAPLTWAALRHMPQQGGSATDDLLGWVINALVHLDTKLYTRAKPRMTGVINRPWRAGKNGSYYSVATCDGGADVLVHQNGFLSGLHYAEFPEGSRISFEPDRNGNVAAGTAAGPDHVETDRLREFDDDAVKSLVIDIRKRLYYPVIQVWRDGRSIKDSDCPPEYLAAMRTNLACLAAVLREPGLPLAIGNEIRFLLSCMHKDSVDGCIEWLCGQVRQGRIRSTRAVAFALGDLTQAWQQDVLSMLLAQPSHEALRVFAYAIWREQHFIDRFSLADLQAILDALKNLLASIKPCPVTREQRTASNWMRAIAEPLELLLGLLRTRASADVRIRMLLQPQQRITKELAQQVERLTALVARSRVELSSRVQIDIDKPQGDLTPTLLYALRLYLTGDDGANAIHISSVAENDGERAQRSPA